ncbi:Tn3 family transposase [Arthrobacter terrae]|uniref:Tn3 family transposase n=1 Tax=Arthrobacter terrae TaxID=2935737 RepID=UPI0028AD9469|nr:Tn3 family transposase [Arthrobacter terrae]
MQTGDTPYDALKPLIGGTLNIKAIGTHWDEILRLATSIKQGTVTAHSCCASLAVTHARTDWPLPCANSDASNVLSLSWTGSKTWNCADGSMPG